MLGHSAAVWGNRAFLFGGLRETISDMADNVAREHMPVAPSLRDRPSQLHGKSKSRARFKLDGP